MGHAPDTKLGRMYKEHIQLILNKDIDGILNQYTPDALLISSFSGDRKPQFFRGHKELREHFQGILGLQGLEVDLTFWAETENPETLMVVEDVTAKSAEGEARMRFGDSWVLRDGRIAIHFAGMVQYPDGSLA
jgi:ketosteroid isomerase-like protein